jgi:hypothetical protein
MINRIQDAEVVISHYANKAGIGGLLWPMGNVAREYLQIYDMADCYSVTSERIDAAEEVINLYSMYDNALWKDWRIARMYQFKYNLVPDSEYIIKD